jgi:hypothetical protein
MTAQALTWSQVHRWRLAQHCLAPRLNRPDFVQAVTRTGGIQAQVLSAAELALWARVDELSRADVQAALWQERSLVKTWAMRAPYTSLPQLNCHYLWRRAAGTTRETGRAISRTMA